MTEINASTSGDPPAARFDTDQWSALVLLCTAAFMIVLDGSTVITALPSIQADLRFSASDLHWVATSYALTFGGLMLLGGQLAEKHDFSETTFLVDGMGYQTALAWCDLRGHLDSSSGT